MHGMPPSAQATWTGSSVEFTRASTAICPQATSALLHARTTSVARRASSAAGACMTCIGATLATGHRGEEGHRFARRQAGCPRAHAAVVGQQMPSRRDDIRRAAVVDLEGVVVRTGEVLREIDQELRRGSGVPVDDLVVVADAEAVVRRRREQPDEQHVRRVQVLNSSTSSNRHRDRAASLASGSVTRISMARYTCSSKSTTPASAKVAR